MNKKTRRTLLGLVGTTLIAILLLASPMAGALQGSLGGAVASLSAKVVGFTASTRELASVLVAARELAKENQRLKSEVALLRQRASNDAELRASYENLRKQLGASVVTPNKLVGAQVVSYQPDNFRQFITIDQGSASGLAPGMAVVSEGVLVGVVREVTRGSARVFLISDPNFRINAVNQSQPNRPNGIVRGLLGGGLVLEKVAANEQVAIGDSIVASGVGGAVPRGTLIGQVSSINAPENAVFKTATVRSPVNLSRLEFVYVILGPQ